MHRTADAGLLGEWQGETSLCNVEHLVEATSERAGTLPELFQLRRVKRFNRARGTVPSPKCPFV